MNTKVFKSEYLDEQAGENALFDPWEHEWPPPESAGLQWLEEIEFDIYRRCDRYCHIDVNRP